MRLGASYVLQLEPNGTGSKEAVLTRVSHKLRSEIA
jgi:hypothetical protein